jgi:hypothetical protein
MAMKAWCAGAWSAATLDRIDLLAHSRPARRAQQQRLNFLPDWEGHSSLRRALLHTCVRRVGRSTLE